MRLTEHVDRRQQIILHVGPVVAVGFTYVIDETRDLLRQHLLTPAGAHRGRVGSDQLGVVARAQIRDGNETTQQRQYYRQSHGHRVRCPKIAEAHPFLGQCPLSRRTPHATNDHSRLTVSAPTRSIRHVGGVKRPRWP